MLFLVERKAVSDEISGASDPVKKATALANKDIDATGNLTDQGKKKVEDELKVKFNAFLETKTKEVAKDKYEHAVTESKQKISIGTKIAAGATSGSYDVRNFNPVADKKDNMFNKTAIFLLAGIAMNLRNGLKQGNMNPGKGQGDLITDLSSSLGSVIKGVAGTKFSVGGGGGSHGGGGHDDHGGGHDDHGGGHGGH